MSMSCIHFSFDKVHKALIHDFSVFLRIVHFRPHVKRANGEMAIGTRTTPSTLPVAL